MSGEVATVLQCQWSMTTRQSDLAFPRRLFVKAYINAKGAGSATKLSVTGCTKAVLGKFEKTGQLDFWTAG
jgi:hypothetical protein